MYVTKCECKFILCYFYVYSIMIDIIYYDYMGQGYVGAACCTYLRSGGL